MGSNTGWKVGGGGGGGWKFNSKKKIVKSSIVLQNSRGQAPGQSSSEALVLCVVATSLLHQILFHFCNKGRSEVQSQPKVLEHERQFSKANPVTPSPPRNNVDLR